MTKQEAGETGIRLLGCYFLVTACGHAAMGVYRIATHVGPPTPYKLLIGGLVFPTVYAIASVVLLRKTEWCLKLLNL